MADLRTDAQVDVADILSYIPRVRVLLLPGSPPERDSNGRHPIEGSASPWDEAAAAWLFDVHAAARRQEAALVWAAFRRRRRRPGSDRHTLAAIEALPDYIRLVADHEDPRARNLAQRAARDLHSWARRGRHILDEARAGEERWTRVPGGLTCTQPVDPDADPQDPDTERCGAPLLLEPGWQYVTAPAVHCRVCHVEWPTAQWYGLVAQAE